MLYQNRFNPIVARDYRDKLKLLTGNEGATQQPSIFRIDDPRAVVDLTRTQPYQVILQFTGASLNVGAVGSATKQFSLRDFPDVLQIIRGATSIDVHRFGFQTVDDIDSFNVQLGLAYIDFNGNIDTITFTSDVIDPNVLAGGAGGVGTGLDVVVQGPGRVLGGPKMETFNYLTSPATRDGIANFFRFTMRFQRNEPAGLATDFTDMYIHLSINL